MTRAAMPSSASASAAFSASCTVMPAPIERDLVALARAQDAAAADLEILVGRVEHRRRRSERAEVRDPLRVGHRGDELRRLVRVAGMEHGRSVDRTQRRDVLERHLRRAVLADRDAGVRAAERERRAADRRHAHEVVRAREEGGERRRERSPAHGLEADRCGDQLLLGDVHLEVALGVRLREGLGERGVRDLAVEGDDVGSSGAERRERVAVRLPRGDLGAELVARELERSDGRRRGERPLRASRSRCERPRARRARRSRRPGRRAACRGSRSGSPRPRRPCPSSCARRRPWACPPSRRPGRAPRRSRRGRARRARSRSSRTLPRGRRTCRGPSPTIVSPRWPSRLTSMIAVRLSSPKCAACSNASHIEPSAISLSPQSTHTRLGRCSRCFAASAIPTPIGRPWPSEPVATSTQGMRGVGWPSSMLPSLR